MDTSAFDVCNGMNLFRENPEAFVGILFTPSELIVWNPETQQVDLVPPEGSEGGPPQIMRSMVCQVKGNTHFVMGSGSLTGCYQNLRHKQLQRWETWYALWICIRIRETTPKLCIAHHSIPVTGMIGHPSDSAGEIHHGLIS